MWSEDAAIGFLRKSSSGFVGHALAWIETREDPVDVLFLLSGDVGAAFGPWETFRYCSLLGLCRAKAVRELALDVLAEPPGHDVDLCAAALALLHARVAFPAEEAPHLSSFRERLARLPAAPEVALARLGLGAGSETEALLGAAAIAALSGDDALPAAPTAVEVAGLLGDRAPAPFAEAARALLARAQSDDGGLTARGSGRRLRELATLRAVAAGKTLGFGLGEAM